MKIKNIFLILHCLHLLQNNYSMQHTNLLFPYEYILDTDRIFYYHQCGDIQLTVRTEIGYSFSGYPVSEISNIISSYNLQTSKQNSLQYLNKLESALAPFFSNSINSWQGQFSQQFTPYAGNTAAQLISFCGEIQNESMVAQCEVWISSSLKIGYYLPFYHFALQSINYEINNKNYLFENTICPSIYAEYQKTSAPIQPYNLSGMGDSELLISWQRYFIEERDWITAIFAAIRTGLYLPTKMWNEFTQTTFLKIPFGYDSGLGIPFGGTIEIDATNCIGFGINADCVTFFPSLLERTIKTDLRQTDMLISNQALSLINPGFRESFSVYATAFTENKKHLATLTYQYNKQNESDIIICQSDFSNLIAQSASSLESWTNHNVIFSLMGSFIPLNEQYQLRYEFFLKWGVGGSRSIVENSWGIQFTFVF